MPSFSQRLIDWQRRSGRNDLPWQGTRDAYRVWLSEIMLQQTQVQTVRAYYPRFVARFPDVQSLAAASDDEVMQLWSGLGYYSRARHLHRAAQRVVAEFGGQFPTRVEALLSLPGIGRSTAHAIAAFCAGTRVSIFDANVQRVVARYLGYGGDLAQTAALRELWHKADALLPADHADLPALMPVYTQGLMDLGATVCTPRRAQCGQCPVHADCRAGQSGQSAHYPVKTRKIRRSDETWYWLVVADGPLHQASTRVLLEKRPARGIWAQLHCFAVLHAQGDVLEKAAQIGTASEAARLQWLPGLRHILTHKNLWIVPALLTVQTANTAKTDPKHGRWSRVQDILSGAIATPAPLRAWLDDIHTSHAKLPIKKN